MKSILYFTLETQKRGVDVGGWYPEKMGLAVAVTLVGDEMRSFQESDLPELLQVLRSATGVVGYNLVEFDFKVLSGYPGVTLDGIRYLDLLQEIEEAAGYRVGLRDLEKACTGTSGGHNFLEAVQLWKEGKVQEVIAGRKRVAKRIKAMHEYGACNGEVFYFKNEQKDRQRLAVNWSLSTETGQ